MKIFIAEDDKNIAEGLRYSLMSEGYQVCVCPDKKESLEQLAKESFDLYLLDLALPDGSGYELCEYIKSHQEAPVLFLTACDDEVNVVRGLDMGADDYITKPFRIRELISRMKSALRHYKKENAGDLLTIGSITINVKQAKVFQDSREIPLTAMEYRLLLAFANHPGQVLSRNQLLEGIWDVDGSFINDNTLSVYIRRLREKLEPEGKGSSVIETVRGLGYRMGGAYDKK
ncbi:response regulator transcription factor [Ruminococcus sp. 5_1_39BFAA]|uniref:response regulator transcription factor n=1 Tax=Ruminococcus sp. 5_1_39BFAA TaxID=457412 RepID=UPI00356ACA12